MRWVNSATRLKVRTIAAMSIVIFALSGYVLFLSIVGGRNANHALYRGYLVSIMSDKDPSLFIDPGCQLGAFNKPEFLGEVVRVRQRGEIVRLEFTGQDKDRVFVLSASENGVCPRNGAIFGDEVGAAAKSPRVKSFGRSHDMKFLRFGTV